MGFWYAGKAWTLLFVMLSLGLMLCPDATRGASITYNIQNFPSLTLQG